MTRDQIRTIMYGVLFISSVLSTYHIVRGDGIGAIACAVMGFVTSLVLAGGWYLYRRFFWN